MSGPRLYCLRRKVARGRCFCPSVHTHMLFRFVHFRAEHVHLHSGMKFRLSRGLTGIEAAILHPLGLLGLYQMEKFGDIFIHWE